jgi:MarC family membrane protein
MEPSLHQGLVFTLSTFTTLFFVVDAPACVPLFLAMTMPAAAERRRTAWRASMVAMFTLAAFAAAGGWIFRLLGISLGAFQIAGGILLFLLAIDMLRAQRSRQRTTPEEEAEGVDKDDVSVFPLGIPMLAGPGATATVMVLMSRAEHAWQVAVVFASIAATAAASYGILAASVRIGERLGHTGLNVVQRVMGLILAATAVQFVVGGAQNVLPAMLAAAR